MPSRVDAFGAGRKQVRRQAQCVTNPKPQPQMEFADESETQESGVGNASRDTAPIAGDVWHLMMGEEIVDPFNWRINRK